MSYEELKQLLENGALTKEQFDSMVASMGLKPEEPPTDPTDPTDPTTPPVDDIDKKIQSAIDRATNKLGNENKELRKELEKLRKEKLTAEELKQLEDREREADLAKREAAIKEAENKLFAIKALKAAGLDDGGEDSLNLLELVKGSDEESIKNSVNALKAFVDKKVKAATEELFKKSGRSPQGGSGGKGGDSKNPWKEGQINYTEQMLIEATDPERAKQLKAAAGK